MVVFLELDSTFRNRSSFPLSSSFDVITSSSYSRTDPLTAIDPVSNAAPVKAWGSNSFADGLASNSVGVTVVETAGTFGSTATPAVYVIRSTVANSLKNIDQYYRRTALALNSDPKVRSRIVSYQYLANDRAKIVVDPPVQFVDGDALTIYDPTDTTTALRLFVPTGSLVENAYFGYSLYNDTKNTAASIKSYEPETATVQYVSNASTAAWINSDFYSLRKSVPRLTGNAGGTSTTSIIDLGASAIGLSNMVGSFVYFRQTISGVSPSGESRRIVSFNSTTGFATVAPPFGGSTAGSAFQILAFSYDNYNPIPLITPSSGGPNQYKVRLTDLTIPDLLLANTNGGRPSQYPYVYVRFVSLESRTGLNIISNNPQSFDNNATFKASYTNFSVVTPGSEGVPNNVTGGTAYSGVSAGSRRAQFKSDVVRNLYFRFDGSFNFAVFLPNGELLTLVQPDFYSPSEPNNDVQIMATFSIE